MLTVSTEAQVAGQIDQLFAQLPMPGEVAMKQWRRAMRGYPIDLVRLGVAEIIKTHRYETPPKIAQFCLVVDPEMRKRNDWRRKLTTAELKARMSRPAAKADSEASRVTSDQIAELRKRFPNAFPPAPDFDEIERQESLRKAGHESGEGDHVG